MILIYILYDMIYYDMTVTVLRSRRAACTGRPPSRPGGPLRGRRELRAVSSTLGAVRWKQQRMKRATPNLPTNIVGFIGFDSSVILT